MRRRSIYFTVKRSRMISSMQLLDMPESLVSIGVRTSTTTAPQALLFMNSPLVRAAAEGFAARLEEPAQRSSEHAIQTAFMIALGRQPSADEYRLWQQMINEDAAEYKASGRTDSRRLALTNVCQMLLCTNEFIYVE
jgi:hypothetical protein